jgi:hypothetical protein
MVQNQVNSTSETEEAATAIPVLKVRGWEA